LRSLGLDIGDKRIGVALSDALGILASPLLVFEHTNDQTDITTILDIVSKYSVKCIIVGIPRSLNGTLGLQAEKVSAFADKLIEKSPVPVQYRDERLTTVTAKNLHEESSRKKSTKTKRIEYDAMAAAVILQSFLNETRPLEYPPE
jgi:putative Holliday junction resolvase